ncbi:pyridoxine-5'-phosphate oxidase-like [Cimex lectularius]|uniref:pyridoxal 5'-phosphate synthase n=1 Tax=Cimex lectularius TaxID=79782 RepID=A0A8I6S902_CIMLE|nr:pyridoxine-5'-phosphate oxidase-like [Cimex lectularius]
MSNYQNIGGLRHKYNESHTAFTESHLVSDDPIKQFDHWFQEAKNCSKILEPNAMCLATCNKLGRPSCRFVLLKGYGEEGFTFYTNGESRKGQDMEENSYVSIAFYWEHLSRQIRIEGQVSKLPEEESLKYFKSRPISSQISAAASQQSSVIESREVLVEKATELQEKFGDNVEKPKHWGGYLINPDKIEFWQGQSNRLHDRIIFERKEGSAWVRYRLAP